MRLAAFDPGKKTGIAIWDTDYGDKPHGMATLDVPKLFDWLDDTEKNQYDIFVVEDYLIRPKGSMKNAPSHNWDKGLTLRVIGAIAYRAHQLSCKFHLQQPSIKPIGAGFGGIEYKKGKHQPHHMDAMMHGFYYLVRNRIIKPIGKQLD